MVGRILAINSTRYHLYTTIFGADSIHERLSNYYSLVGLRKLEAEMPNLNNSPQGCRDLSRSPAFGAQRRFKYEASTTPGGENVVKKRVVELDLRLTNGQTNNQASNQPTNQASTHTHTHTPQRWQQQQQATTAAATTATTTTTATVQTGRSVIPGMNPQALASTRSQLGTMLQQRLHACIVCWRLSDLEKSPAVWRNWYPQKKLAWQWKFTIFFIGGYIWLQIVVFRLSCCFLGEYLLTLTLSHTWLESRLQDDVLWFLVPGALGSPFHGGTLLPTQRKLQLMNIPSKSWSFRVTSIGRVIINRYAGMHMVFQKQTHHVYWRFAPFAMANEPLKDTHGLSFIIHLSYYCL